MDCSDASPEEARSSVGLLWEPVGKLLIAAALATVFPHPPSSGLDSLIASVSTKQAVGSSKQTTPETSAANGCWRAGPYSTNRVTAPYKAASVLDQHSPLYRIRLFTLIAGMVTETVQ